MRTSCAFLRCNFNKSDDRMLRICLFVVFLAVIGGTVAQIDCSGKPNGIYGHGCRSYTNCTNGRGTIVDCKPGYAFDILAGECRPVDLVPPPCGDQLNCTVLPDGSYPIMPDCRYFFTCYQTIFMGSNPCNNPPDIGELVFDIELQVCNWRWDVPEPCGTFVKPTFPPVTGDYTAEYTGSTPTNVV